MLVTTPKLLSVEKEIGESWIEEMKRERKREREKERERDRERSQSQVKDQGKGQPASVQYAGRFQCLPS